jgi:hypothetical protein
MLKITLGNNVQRQRQFAELYTGERGDLHAFWRSVRQTFGEETEKQLRLDGQLGYLTLNNAPLMRQLHEAERENPLSATIDLAKRGYFSAEKRRATADRRRPSARRRPRLPYRETRRVRDRDASDRAVHRPQRLRR